MGDFNLSTVNLKSLISNIGDWFILDLRGSSISWIRGDQESDIDHALINSHMKDLLSHGSFVDFPPISDHKPLLVTGISNPSDSSFIIPKK